MLHQLLERDQDQTISRENLKTVVQVILRLIDPKKVIEQPSPFLDDTMLNKHLEITGLGYLDESSQLCFRSYEVQKLQTYFNPFYINRLQHQGKQLELKKGKIAEQENKKNTFKPQINQGSEVMANRRKEKSLLQLNPPSDAVVSVDPVSKLRQSANKIQATQEQRALKLAKHAYYATQEQDDKVKSKFSGTQTESITLNAHGGRSDDQRQPLKSTSTNLTSKFDELYALRKKKFERKDKSKEEYEFERMGQECTFTPMINRHKSFMKQPPETAKGGLDPNFYSAPQSQRASARDRNLLHEQKAIDRMKKAREDKSRKQ